MFLDDDRNLFCTDMFEQAVYRVTPEGTISRFLSGESFTGFDYDTTKFLFKDIRKHSGFIDKYIGDAIMALFPGGAKDAVAAAVGIHQELLLYDKHRGNSGYPPISIGIGIHKGNVILGILGEAERMEGTVISDAVNTASRLEGLTKIYGADVLVKEQVIKSVKGAFRHRFLDFALVKGKTENLRIYEIICNETSASDIKKIKSIQHLQKGVILFHEKRYGDALALFEKVSVYKPQNKAAVVYKANCHEALTRR